MSTPDEPQKAACPVCGDSMRREKDGVQVPPKPGVFWFCANLKCSDGKRNRVFSGG